MTKSKRPSIKVLFVAREELEEHTGGGGRVHGKTDLRARRWWLRSKDCCKVCGLIGGPSLHAFPLQMPHGRLQQRVALNDGALGLDAPRLGFVLAGEALNGSGPSTRQLQFNRVRSICLWNNLECRGPRRPMQGSRQSSTGMWYRQQLNRPPLNRAAPSLLRLAGGLLSIIRGRGYCWAALGSPQ